MTKMSQTETRTATINMESVDGTFKGIAVPWDSWSVDLGGFREKFDARAFGENPQTDWDVRATKNHDPNYVMGRTTAGTLELINTDKGLQFIVHPPEAQWVSELRESVARGDINQCSFEFGVEIPQQDDSWERGEDGLARRTVHRAWLRDVSIVTYPAYPQTTVSVRSIINQLQDTEDSGPDEPLEDQGAQGSVELPDYSLHMELLKRI